MDQVSDHRNYGETLVPELCFYFFDFLRAFLRYRCASCASFCAWGLFFVTVITVVVAIREVGVRNLFQ